MASLNVPYSPTNIIQYAVPSNGNTVVINSNTDILISEPAGTLATLTITLPSTNLYDGRIVKICSTQIVTTLTLNGGTILNALTALTVGSANAYVYRAAGSNWYACT